MALNGLGSPIPSVTPSTAPSTGTTNARGTGSPSEFRDALQGFQNLEPKQAKSSISPVKFSNHAVERMRSRGISYSPEQMEKIENAIQKASAKGAKNTLLLTDNSAMIVSVKDSTVVTVMDRNSMKDNVFTNIDSTVMV
jgi:flagellar operon protein